MPKEHEKLIEQLTEDYEHSLFRLAVHRAALQEGDVLLAEKEELAKAGATGPSPAALRKFELQLETKLRPSPLRSLGGLRRKTAVAVVIMACVFLMTLTNVQAFRNRILGLWAEFQPQAATFQLRESETVVPAEGLSINWTQAYTPTYIPAGFVEQRVEITRLRKEITYVHGESQIKYMELWDSKNLTVNTENASHIETLAINGVPGMLILAEPTVTVVWALEEHMFVIQGNVDMETALAIARGVKYVE